MKQSDEGDHKTGLVYSYRLEGDQTFHGNYDTRHEAVGHATILGRLVDKDWHVRWHESMWTEREEPVECGYCGYETYYSPLVHWTLVADCEASPFCSTHCRARYEYQREATA
jgi:hypothetical protein